MRLCSEVPKCSRSRSPLWSDWVSAILPNLKSFRSSYRSAQRSRYEPGQKSRFVRMGMYLGSLHSLEEKRTDECLQYLYDVVVRQYLLVVHRT